MNLFQTTRPAPEPPGPRRPRVENRDLDEAIRATELGIIDREERLRRRVREVFGRVGNARSMAVGAAGLAGVGLVAWLLKTPARGSPLQRVPPAPRSWTRLVALAWPLVPVGLRDKVSPAMLTAITTVGLPLMDRLLRGQAEPQTEVAVDLRRYAGRWYEIARLPTMFEGACDRDVTATYTLMGDQVRVLNRCMDDQGREKVVEGVARVVPGSQGSQLMVTQWPWWLRWLPLAWAPYWILRVDPNYRTAIVGTPGRGHLWLLARTPEVDDATLRDMLLHAQAQGFDTNRLQLTEHTRRGWFGL